MVNLFRGKRKAYTAGFVCFSLSSVSFTLSLDVSSSSVLCGVHIVFFSFRRSIHFQCDQIEAIYTLSFIVAVLHRFSVNIFEHKNKHRVIVDK